MAKDKIIIAIWINDEEELDECFFFHDQSREPDGFDTGWFINFDNEETIISKLVDDTYYDGERFCAIQKAVLTDDEFFATKPYKY